VIQTETKIVNRKTRRLTFDFPPGDYDGVCVNFPHDVKIKTYNKVASHGLFWLMDGDPLVCRLRCTLSYIPPKGMPIFTNYYSLGPGTLRLEKGGQIAVEFVERATVRNRPSLWSSFRESTAIGFVLFQPKDHKASFTAIGKAIRCS
jgi:hypothetical protein